MLNEIKDLDFNPSFQILSASSFSFCLAKTCQRLDSYYYLEANRPLEEEQPDEDVSENVFTVTIEFDDNLQDNYNTVIHLPSYYVGRQLLTKLLYNIEPIRKFIDEDSYFNLVSETGYIMRAHLSTNVPAFLTIFSSTSKLGSILPRYFINDSEKSVTITPTHLRMCFPTYEEPT